jgi:hypothetical protein
MLASPVKGDWDPSPAYPQDLRSILVLPTRQTRQCHVKVDRLRIDTGQS